MATLTIVEPHCSGHRMQYVRWIAREALVQGHNVNLATLSNCLEHPSYLALQQECEGQVRIQVIVPNRAVKGSVPSEKWLEKNKPIGLAGREVLYYYLFASYFRGLDERKYPDVFFASYLDYCAYAFGLLGSPFGDVPWGGIVLRPAFHFDSMGVKGPKSRLHPIKEKLFLRTLGIKQLRRLFTIDESLVRFVSANHPELANKLQYVPDPVRFSGARSRTEARRELGISNDSVVLLVFGELTSRKGIDALLNAAHEIGLPEKLVILLAGKQDTQTKLLLQSSQVRAMRKTGRLHELDGFLSDEETHMVFRTADIVWLGYRGHYGGSAVLIQAGMIGLPVVACDVGLIDWMARKHNLGPTVPIDDPVAVAGAIHNLTCDNNLRNELGENGKNFSTTHEVGNFARIVCDLLRLDQAANSARVGRVRKVL